MARHHPPLRWLLVVWALAVHAGCGGGGDASPGSPTEDTVTPAPVGLPTAAPISATTTTTTPALSWSGTGAQKTDRFHLPGGAYKATWRFGADCSYFTSLKLADGTQGSDSIGDARGPIDGTNNLYGIEEGDYYVDVNTGPAPGCPWTVTLTQG